MATVLIDDVRRFADDRECLTYRSSRAAIQGLASLLESGTEIEELWLDFDLAGDDTLRPVLAWLERMDGAGQRPAIRKTFIVTSSSRGTHEIRLVLDRLGYPYERLYSLRNRLTWKPRDGA